MVLDLSFVYHGKFKFRLKFFISIPSHVLLKDVSCLALPGFIFSKFRQKFNLKVLKFYEILIVASNTQLVYGDICIIDCWAVSYVASNVL